MIRRTMMAVLLAGCMAVTQALADKHVDYRPYVLASTQSTSLAEALSRTREQLSGAGFEIVGGYSPYSGAEILVVSSDQLKTTAAGSQHGGYGAVQRISLTRTGDLVQVAYTNPPYMAHIYQLNDDLQNVARQLGAALGREKEFGSEHGLKPYGLRNYHYMVFMPYFRDNLELAQWDSHEQAIAAVEKNLASGVSGTRKVYRVDLPGKQETVFGVALAEGEGSDNTVMQVTDVAELKHTAHLPYELLVSKGEVFALHGKFRIAQSFPDLTMGTFMQISGAPGAIEEALEAVAGNSE